MIISIGLLIMIKRGSKLVLNDLVLNDSW